jgi:hypothetical protein
MPTETIVILAAIVAAFTIFGLTLCWAEFRTRGLRRSEE